MSHPGLSIILRKPGPETSVVNIQGRIFIHTFPGLPLFAVHQTAIHVATTKDFYVTTQHAWKEIPNWTKFYAALYFQKHLRVFCSQAALKTFNRCSLTCAEKKYNPISQQPVVTQHCQFQCAWEACVSHQNTSHSNKSSIRLYQK